MARRHGVFGLFILAVALFAPAVRANDWDACKNSNPKVSIFGCSAIVDAGTDTKENIDTAYYKRGNAYSHKGEYDRAIEDFGKAIALNPKYAKAYINRGNAYYHKGEYDRATKDYDKAIALDPKYALAYYNRGTAYSHKGEYDRAIKNYDKAIALNPKYAKAYYSRGVAYEKLGNKQKAETDYQKTLLLLPGNKKVIAALQRLKAAPVEKTTNTVAPAQ